MSYFLSPIGNEQQIDANGDPLVGGKIYTYLAGSTTPTATYTDDTGGTQQANPIILNALGLPDSSAPIWLAEGITYKFVFTDADDVATRAPVDDISGINDAATSASEWVESGFVPTYVSATSFTVPGDQTDVLLVGRRLKTANTAGTIYSTITASVFTTLTTVTVVNDSGVLDSGLSSAAYGLASPANPSLPNAAAVLAAMGISTGYAISKAASGYIKLPAWLGGLVLQWGAGTSSGTAASNGSVTFPLAFPNACRQAFGVIGGSSLGDYTIQTTASNQAGATFTVQRDAGYADGVGFSYFAIGD
jgi:hypothetical protein